MRVRRSLIIFSFRFHVALVLKLHSQSSKTGLLCRGSQVLGVSVRACVLADKCVRVYCMLACFLDV